MNISQVMDTLEALGVSRRDAGTVAAEAAITGEARRPVGAIPALVTVQGTEVQVSLVRHRDAGYSLDVYAAAREHVCSAICQH